MNHVNWSQKVIDHMLEKQCSCVVVIKHGAAYTGRPLAIYSDTVAYRKLPSARKITIVGWYSRACTVRHLADDVVAYCGRDYGVDKSGAR